MEVPELTEKNEDQCAQSERKNLAVFINKCDAEVYKLIKPLASLRQIQHMSYGECKELIVKHLAPTPTKFTQRHKFRKCKQGEDAAAEFISKLRTIANDCEFGNNYEEAILDQLRSGMKDEKLISVLLAKADLDLAIMVEAVYNNQITD